MSDRFCWKPTRTEIESTHIFSFMKEKGFASYSDLFQWSIQHRAEFWGAVIDRLKIRFKTPASTMLNVDSGVETPKWLVGATLNIVDSCFQADVDDTAICFQKESEPIQKMSYGELNRLSNRVANGLIELGLKKGDAVAVDMVMTAESVAIYLGIIKAGCVVVSIADSFSADEIGTRLRMGQAKLIFTQDVIFRSGKKLPMAEKVFDAGAPRAVILPFSGRVSVSLRETDLEWEAFLSDNRKFDLVACTADDTITILFSSGTTGEPKGIPWTHATPIKCAMDAYFHHDIHPGDRLCWPTNLGWMMGPWLIFASLINRATIALYYDVPTSMKFGEFVQNAKVTMLGLVPSIVKIWREAESMGGFDWSSLKCLSSTGECSNADDYTYLMALAENKPVIEYCGGTEIGGGYITGTLVQPQYPSTFSTPTLGLDMTIIDGELFLIPPSIGLSTRLLNRDHHETYFEGTPKGPNGEILRRHGDEFESLGNGYYKGLGRVDDTMNLGGIKTSSLEIERVLNQVENVFETAAIGVSPKGGGPSMLVIFAVLTTENSVDINTLKMTMQERLKKELNPLFKIADLVIEETLPRTASNKIMRRQLRTEYQRRSLA